MLERSSNFGGARTFQGHQWNEEPQALAPLAAADRKNQLEPPFPKSVNFEQCYYDSHGRIPRLNFLISRKIYDTPVSANKLRSVPTQCRYEGVKQLP